MKKRMFLTAVLGLLMVGLVSCNKNEEIPDDSDTDQNGLTSGEWVDMGLPSGLRWASYNLGASKPEGYGDYYAWADEFQHDVYDWDSYYWSTSNSSGGLGELTKYNTKAFYGTVDNKQVIESRDDAASVYWGDDGARIPTKYEWDELLENSTCQGTEINGVWGRKFTSRINGNSIFFPAAGRRIDASRTSAGETGYYWSSTLKSEDPTDAYHLYFGQYGFGMEDCGYRCYGYSVRAVKEY